MSNRNLTQPEADTIEKLINAARDVMHHDTDPADAAFCYEQETLTQKFALILYGKRL